MSSISTDTTYSAEDAELMSPESLPGQPDVYTDDRSALLWEYHNEGTLNGVKVREEDRNLPVDTEDMLQAAFELNRTPRSVVLLITPDTGAAEYEALLQRQSRGEIMIVGEDKQYSATKDGFVVWIRYEEIEYRLHPRFKHLKETV